MHKMFQVLWADESKLDIIFKIQLNCYNIFFIYFRFKNVANVALLYAGSQRGKLDQISLILFPLSFLLFTIIYWVLYLSESRKSL